MFGKASIGGVALALALAPAVAQGAPGHEAPEGATHGAGIEHRSEAGSDHADGSATQGSEEGKTRSDEGKDRGDEGQTRGEEATTPDEEATTPDEEGKTQDEEGKGRGDEGKAHGKDGKGSGSTDKSHGKSGADHGKCAEHESAYIVAGPLVSDTLTSSEEGTNTYSGQVVIEVARTNEHARAARGETETYTLEGDRVRGPISVEALAPGDWVKVIGKIEMQAPKCESTTSPKVDVRRLVIHGPKHADSKSGSEGSGTEGSGSEGSTTK